MRTKKKSFIDEETIELEGDCSDIIRKSKDMGSFNIPIAIGDLSVDKALLDLGDSINLMPLVMLKRICDFEVKATRMTL